MPHVIREYHLDELCANCKNPHGNNIELIHQHHKIYEKILCEHCGYVSIRRRDEKEFLNRYEFM